MFGLSMENEFVSLVLIQASPFSTSLVVSITIKATDTTLPPLYISVSELDVLIKAIQIGL